jgi:hypothetical protein
MKSFGPILFRTMPFDYLSTINTAEDIEKSLEPSRIAEVLSFYYVLLQRDKDNKVSSSSPYEINLTDIPDWYTRCGQYYQRRIVATAALTLFPREVVER